MNMILIPCPANEVSDGYHTFGELYAHRIVLFIALMRQRPDISWRSQYHDDGTRIAGWFIAGMGLPSGMITYHLPDEYWTQLNNTGIHTFDLAPKWDGHNSNDVLERLLKWQEKPAKGYPIAECEVE